MNLKTNYIFTVKFFLWTSTQNASLNPTLSHMQAFCVFFLLLSSVPQMRRGDCWSPTWTGIRPVMDNITAASSTSCCHMASRFLIGWSSPIRWDPLIRSRDPSGLFVLNQVACNTCVTCVLGCGCGISAAPLPELWPAGSCSWAGPRVHWRSAGERTPVLWIRGSTTDTVSTDVELKCLTSKNQWCQKIETVLS